MVHDLIRDERLALVERLGSLATDDWNRPSLCEGWSIRVVLAHLTMPYIVPRKEVVGTVMRTRSISAAFDQKAQEVAAGHEPAELVEVLRANATTRFHPPGMPYEAPLTDIVAHNADIRWALGDDHVDWHDPARLRSVLDFLTSPRARAGFLPAGRLKGITLAATDLDWRHGSGAEVCGPALSLTMAALGRRAALDDLSGNGLPVLAR